MAQGVFGPCDLDAASTRSVGRIRSPLRCLKLLLPTGQTHIWVVVSNVFYIFLFSPLLGDDSQFD